MDGYNDELLEGSCEAVHRDRRGTARRARGASLARTANASCLVGHAGGLEIADAVLVEARSAAAEGPFDGPSDAAHADSVAASMSKPKRDRRSGEHAWRVGTL